MQIQRVKNEAVWGHLKTLFLGTSVLFLINIFFGFDNALTAGELPRWQTLIHLHSGSIGWITLSAIGVAIWVLTNQRDVTETYETRIGYLVWAAIIIFGVYIISFGTAFSRPSGILVIILPIFGSASVTILWISAIYSLIQLRRQDVVSTVQILAAGALLVAAVGATIGALFGLERAVGRFLPLPDNEDRVGAHAGMMDTYLFLVASAVIEWFVFKDLAKKWSIAGLIQGLLWTIGAVLVPVAFFLGMVDQLLPVFGIFLLLGLVIFLVRVAWRAIKLGPLGKGVEPWIFFGTLWLVIYMAFFLYAVNAPDFNSLPFWFFAFFVHAAFVGMMTNLIFGVLSARTEESRNTLSWGEPVSLWLINLGILVFLGLKIAADIRYGAIVMGIGVLLGVATFILRLRAGD